VTKFGRVTHLREDYILGVDHAPILRGVGFKVPIFSPSRYMLTLLDAELANLTTKYKMEKENSLE